MLCLDSWWEAFEELKLEDFGRGSPDTFLCRGSPDIGRGSPDRGAVHAMSNPMDGHLGPFPVKGTLTAEQRQEIREATGCSASIRERGQWNQRMLTLCGPCDKLQAAHKMALEKVELNGDEGGRASAAAEPRDPPPHRSWKAGWSDSWKNKEWPTKEEVEDLQRRLQAAEQQCANNAWRIQVLEGWYWWCNWNEGGQPYAAQSSQPNPANHWRQPGRGENKKGREASPSSERTKSPSEAPTVVPEVQPAGDGVQTACEPIPEHDDDREKKRRRGQRKRRQQENGGRSGDRERTAWRPKNSGGRGSWSEER